MSAELASAIAVLFSMICLLALIKSDGKRYRREGRRFGLPQTARALLVCAGLLPGVVLTVLGYYSSLLVWLGSITVMGWILALLPPRLF